MYWIPLRARALRYVDGRLDAVVAPRIAEMARVSRPRIVAHRGRHNAADRRENTIPAIRAAAEWGAEVVEIDVRLTADGDVVLLHDATLERVWGDPRAVSDMTSAQVRMMGADDQRIPTLAEALDASRMLGTVLLIDMDHSDPARAAAEDRARSRCRGANGVVRGDEAMRIVREELPNAVIHQEWTSPQAPDADALADLRPTYVNAHHLLVGEALVDGVHALGARVACWTVDDPAQASHLGSIGVDSLTTNDLDAAADASPDEDARRMHVAQEIAEGAAENRRSRSRDGHRIGRHEDRPSRSRHGGRPGRRAVGARRARCTVPASRGGRGRI